MIYIYGDSHAFFSFKNLQLYHRNLRCNSITMFRIGRDNIIINYNKNIIRKDDIIILSYGEVDCRCHIQRQINLGKTEDDVINELVSNYFTTIKNNITQENVKVIIVGIIPPMNKSESEVLNEPELNEEILSQFPVRGKNEDRVRYVNKVNKLLEELSNNNNYIYFNPYSYYTNTDGTLKQELSDGGVHLGNNTFFLERFMDLHKKISPPSVNKKPYISMRNLIFL